MRLALDRHAPTWLIGAAVLVYLASAAAGFFLGFGFARNAQGGALMGLVAGINGALFCTLVADWLLTRLVRRPARRP
jgi:membrane protein implicated in regulation of membrane protease activity